LGCGFGVDPRISQDQLEIPSFPEGKTMKNMSHICGKGKKM